MARLQANPIHTEDLKSRIRSKLVATGVSQYQLAVFSGLNPQTISRYLSGQTWSEATEAKLKRALTRLPRRKSPKHRRIRLCRTCDADISARHGNARQCSDCEIAALEAGQHVGANHGKA